MRDYRQLEGGGISTSGCLWLFKLAALTLFFALGVAFLMWVFRENAQIRAQAQAARQQQYIVKEYVVPLVLVEDCIQGNLSVVWIKGTKSSIDALEVLNCLDDVGYRVLPVGRRE